MSMTSQRPYLIRAIYEWIVDNELTPYILIFAHGDNVQVPQEYVNKDGQLVLNVAPRAVSDLLMDNESISFSARFGGLARDIYVPCSAVLCIYAKENGQGMVFELESEPTPDPEPSAPGDKPTSKPGLRLVK